MGLKSGLLSVALLLASVGAAASFELKSADIAPGATQHLRFTLDPRDLSCVNEAGDHVVAASAYRVFVGGGQPGTMSDLAMGCHGIPL